MTSTAVVTQGPSPEDDYGLDAIAQHNAALSTEQFPAYQDDAKGLGIFQDGAYYTEDPSYAQNPPTPRSNTDDGVRTRSGRSTRGRTDSPFSTTKSRNSKSPSAKPRKDRAKSSKVDRAKAPKLTAPLSVLTKDMEVPVKDMEAWVHRPDEIRHQEVNKKDGHIGRPMNSFMLYRSAYAERTKAWCDQNNHQIVSVVVGESWPMEPEEVRNQFTEWAKLERDNHAKAFPGYKFSPAKANTKRRKADFTDDEDDASDLDGDPDGEYRAGGKRQRRQIDPHAGEQAYLESNVGFSSHPYYGGQVVYDPNMHAYAAHYGRPVPSNAGYDGSGIAYNPQTGQYVHTSIQQQPQHGYVQDVRGVRVPTPSSITAISQTLGGYGMPGTGHMSAEDLFAATSRTGTPAGAMTGQYNQYGQPISYPAYQSYTPQPYQQPQNAYEHQQYLHQASQPQQAIDPELEAALAAVGHDQSHFDSAIGDLGPSGLEGYFEESTSPNQTLAPSWSPTDPLAGH